MIQQQEGRVYKALYTKGGALKHSNECSMAFGKKDPCCPRCIEMLNGATPRNGWQKDYYRLKAHNDFIEKQAKQKHNCIKEGCGPVCTAFEW